MTLNEVSPPGFGHTKGDKEKGIKKGGTAAAFDKARKEGRFKGSKSDMFAIMSSEKNKGDKPHYKPGTDKKYKKYQDEAFGFEIDKGEHKKASKKAKMRNLAKGNTNPNEKAAAEKKAGGPKLYGEDKEMPFVSRKDRGAIRKRAKNLFKRDIKGEHHGVNEGVGRAAIGAAIGSIGGPVGAAAGAAIGASLGKKKVSSGAGGKKKLTNFFKAEPKVTRRESVEIKESVLDLVRKYGKKKEEKQPQKAMDAGARAKRKLARREYRSKVGAIVPKELEDQKSWLDFKGHFHI